MNENKLVTNKTYYKYISPYKAPPKCNYNLLELSRYARSVKKKVVDLSVEEINMFKLKD